MIHILLSRLRQGRRTLPHPKPLPALPERFRGRPVVDASKCARDGCRVCEEACPTEAITLRDGVPLIDLGRCLFCPECEEACPTGAISYSGEHRLAVRGREDLLVDGKTEYRLARQLDAELMRVFGRSLKLRVV
ncbi:MAG: 4Fe-4S binding protein, partial [Acidobacteriota bacterium]|nr:4Fe-4S binding protein [Acidobacteriota bacterium]